MTSFIGRSIAFLMGLIGVTVFGGGVTTAICTFTPLCSISFALPFVGLRTTAKQLVDAMEGDASERAGFLLAALDKFEKLQKTFSATPETPDTKKLELNPETKPAEASVATVAVDAEKTVEAGDTTATNAKK